MALGIGNAIGIPFKHGIEPNWSTILFGQDDLALWMKSRSGRSLIDDYGNNATILTPVGNFPANSLSSAHADYRQTTNSFAIEWFASFTGLSGTIVNQNYGINAANPGYSVTQTAFNMASNNKGIFNNLHNLNLLNQGWIHVFILADRAGYVDIYRNNVRVVHTDISADAAESLTNAQIFSINTTSNNASNFAYFRLYKFTGAVPGTIVADIASNYSTGDVSSNLLTALAAGREFNFNRNMVREMSTRYYNCAADEIDSLNVGGVKPPTVYSLNGSLYNLNYGYSVYKYIENTNYLVKNIPLIRNGTKRANLNSADIPLMSAPATDGWYWIRDIAAITAKLNLADCKIKFTNVFFDRSNATIWNASARNYDYAYINLTGTGGTCDITINGLTKTATFASNLTITVINFVTANYNAYRAIGIELTYQSTYMLFQYECGLTAATAVNTSGNLAGAVVLEGDYDAADTKSFHISKLNQRTLMSMLNDDYKALFFVKGSSKYYGESYNGSVESLERDEINEIILYNTDKTGTNHRNVLCYTGDLFAAVTDALGNYEYDAHSHIKLGYLKSTKPQLVIRIDDGLVSANTGWLPYFNSKGITKITASILTHMMGTAGYMTWAQVAALRAAGWEIDIHGYDEANTQYFTATNFVTHFENAIAEFLAQGYSNTGIITPNNYGGCNLYGREWILRNHRAMWFGYLPQTDQGASREKIDLSLLDSMVVTLGAVKYDISTPAGIAAIKVQLDIALAGNRIAAIFTHAYQAAEATGFTDIITYAQGLGIDIVTNKEALDNCKYLDLV